jgi:hypothetical protein
MKLTKKKAKELSLIKWDYARKTGCKHEDLTDYLMGYYREKKIAYMWCPFCDFYGTFDGCGKCPLKKINKNYCNEKEGSIGLYYKWGYAKTKKARKKYAEQIYQDIKRS